MRYKASINTVEKKIILDNVTIIQGETVELQFEMDRLYEGVDLQKEATCFVIYKIDSVEGYASIQAEEETEGDKVIYTWKVPKEITQHHGDLTITLRLDSLDNVILKTKPKTLTITKSLMASIPAIEPFGVDIAPFAVVEEDEPITVSERNLIIPGRLQNIAVQNDKKSEVVKIVLPRYKQGIDLGAKRIYLKTICPGGGEEGHGGRDDLDLTATAIKTSSTITVTWTLQAPQTSFPGTLSLQLRVEDANFKWETLPTTVTIAVSLDAEPVVPVNPSFVEQALQEIGTAMDAVRKAKESAESAATKAQNSAVLATNKAVEFETKLKEHNSATDTHMDIRQRVAIIDKNLNTLQNAMANVNIGHDAKQGVSGYSEVRLPKTAASGNMDVVVRGRTSTNLLGKNGDFNYGNKWNSGGGAKLTLNKNVLNLKPTEASVDCFYARINSVKIIEKPNSYYLVHGEIMVKNNDKLKRVYVAATGNDTYVKKGSSKTKGVDIDLLNVFQKTGTMFKTVDDITTSSQIIYCTTSEKTTIADVDARNIMLTEITEDEYNNSAILDLIEKYPYTEDTKSVPVSTRIRSGAGKNLLRLNEFDKWTQHEGAVVRFKQNITVPEWGATDATEIETTGGTSTIKLHDSCGTTLNNAVYSKSIYIKNIGETDVFIGYNAVPSVSDVVKPGESKFVKREAAIGNGKLTNQIHIKASKVADDLKLIAWRPKIEEGPVATPWIPNGYVDVNGIYFSATDGGEIAELRSLPNGVCDEIRKNANGSYELVKRVGKSVLSSDTKHHALNDTSNVFCIVFKKNSDCINLIKGNDGRVFIPTMIQYPGVTVSTLPADTSLINNYFTTHENDSSFYFIFAKGTTVEGAKSKLAGTTIYYQLAEPKIIPLQASGTIHSMPSGTVYLEHSTADAGVYTGNMGVLYKDLPILKLEKLSKLDFNTGMETELDATKAVVKADKLSFTHPDLAVGDIVSFIYEYNRQSSAPDLVANFYDSRYVIADSKNGKFYQWEIGANNGVPAIQLKEV